MTVDTVDFAIPEAKMKMPVFAWNPRAKPTWETFFDETTCEVFDRGGFIVDVGGGMRIDANRGDRADASRQKLVANFLSSPSVRFHVTDYTDQYHPDSVEDLHFLSFADASVDGLFCIAVLEHVYDPKKAAEEIMRVLKPNSTALLYVPFIYRYHANLTTDYRDYFRYSKDGIAYLFRHCRTVEICPVRGIFESFLHFTPLRCIVGLPALVRLIDWGTHRMRFISSRQTSGYFVRLVR